MELEFDKEMDALLRQSATRSVPVGDTAKVHLDADAMAAFAENALPQKRREIYMRHLAECDPCRKTLSNLITLNAQTEPEMAAVIAPVAVAAIPWYRKLFAGPNLAYTMGALVLVFGGMIGFVAFQNMNSGDTTVSQVQDKEMFRESAPAVSEPMAAASNSNAASNAANTVTNSPGEIPRAVGTADPSAESDAGQIAAAAPPPPQPVTSAPATGTASNAAAKPVTTDVLDVAGGQPATKELAKSADEERKAEDKRAGNNRVNAKQEAENNITREQQLNQLNQMNQVMTPGAGNRKDSGPNRAAVPRDNRDYDDSPKLKARKADSPANVTSRSESAPSVRTAGGKKFEQKQGAWYDTSYRGQATTNVRRGTDDYRKLDGGLRSIAENIGGTVVVVWNGKAYRIQ